MARESRAAWERRVGRWECSGLSAREFAVREGVNRQTLSFWKWKLHQPTVQSARKRRPSVDFVEVVPAVEVEPDAPIEVVVERYRIRIQRGSNEATLTRVLDALKVRA
jgi:hypothetical protein